MPDQSSTDVSGDGHPPYEEEFRLIGTVLERDATTILERWYERASEEQVHADPDQREAAMNELLHMLQSLGRQLHQQSSHALEAATAMALEHGRQRSDIGWDVVELVRDYEILHSVALEHLGHVLHERLSYRQAMIIARVMNAAIGQAVSSYSELAQQQLEEQIRQQKIELAKLTLDLTDAEHRQRQKIARAIHDDFQQLLVAAYMRLQAAAAASPPDKAGLRETEGMLNQLLDMSRNIAVDLHPVILERRGLPAAIEWLAETFQQRYQLNVTVDLRVPHGTTPGPMALRRLIFDVVRELLFNIVKHARTDRAWVTVCCREQSPWEIVIEDRGAGSANIDSASGHGFGMDSVRYRIEQIGGTMQVNSKPGEGTRINLTIPLEPA